ncbi:hypothetical protein [Rhizobium halophytocola]|uniref:SHOCT domain-containing protein n=1 Tax=Rhizobium halophytocola TaxID=735519 RepID=A0ABS4DW31_9HYPH|nr:hypothetical protein [Rhizobium halophytocola]MBP1849901.1 hypothetical protein [Rhizobium halophytocola]
MQSDQFRNSLSACLSGRRLTVLAAMALLAGCSARDVMVQPISADTADSSIVTIEEAHDPMSSGQLRTADGYPSFSTPLTAANSQMSNEEAAALSARMNALSHARRAGSVSEAEYRRQMLALQQLAANHGRDTEAAIGK